MSDDRTSKKAFPNQQYDGNFEGYEDYNTEKEAWLINNDGFEEHLASEPPKEEDYTGNGAEGRFNAAKNRDKKKGKEIWAAAIGGQRAALNYHIPKPTIHQIVHSDMCCWNIREVC